MLALCLFAGLALVAPAGAGGASAGHPAGRHHRARGHVIAITTAYVEQFYPLWFTYRQSSLVPHNELIGPVRISPLYRGVVAINDDTLYASLPIDFTTRPVTPVILTVPETVASYSVLTLDAFGNVFQSGVPSKPSSTNLPKTVYAFVPEGFAGSLPSGATPVTMPFDFTFLIFRVDKFANGVDQTLEASEFRAALQVQTLSDHDEDPNGGTTRILPEVLFRFPVKTIADSLIRFLPIRFLKQLQTAVHSSNTPPLTPEEQAMSDEFDAVFGAGGSSVRPAMRSAFSRGARAAHRAILDNYLGNLGPNSWIHFTNIGSWGDEVLDRASITEFIQFGNGISTAAYYHTFRDGHRAALRGSAAGGYVLTFPPGGQPPAERFWSLTAYTPRSIELIRNSADKYVVASYTPGLQTSRDGSVSIYISRLKPAGVPEANWLPVSRRPFNLMLRVYGVVAGSSVANNSYVPPAVVRRLPGQ